MARAAPAQLIGFQEKFLRNLQLGSKDIVVIDTEAGVEQFGRGIADSVDIVLVVLDPSYESVKFSQKILLMMRECKTSVFYVLNRADDKAS